MTLAAGALATTGCATSEPSSASPQRSQNPPPPTLATSGVDVDTPPGWHLTRPPITDVTFPAERLLLTSYPTRGGGNCAPDRAVRDLPPGGALIYLFEYRPERGEVWANLRRRDFPPRPAHFALRRADKANLSCWRVASHVLRFRAADRPFQLHVALGRNASPGRRAQVLRILDSLRFSPLPAPPPDPYAGWRLLTTETGDSLRTPPGWTAAARTSPRRYPRPRGLFFASNRRLVSLPPARPRTRRALGTRIPVATLDAFPDDGVLLWIREDPRAAPSRQFPRLPRRAWPQAGDFLATQARPAQRWPRLRWERAAATAQRHRFSVWLVSGPDASAGDRAEALKGAAALALSTGGYRDARCRRACRTG